MSNVTLFDGDLNLVIYVNTMTVNSCVSISKSIMFTASEANFTILEMFIVSGAIFFTFFKGQTSHIALACSWTCFQVELFCAPLEISVSLIMKVPTCVCVYIFYEDVHVSVTCAFHGCYIIFDVAVCN